MMATLQSALAARIEQDLVSLWGCEIPPGAGQPGQTYGAGAGTRRPRVYRGRPRHTQTDDEIVPAVYVMVRECLDRPPAGDLPSCTVVIRVWAYSDTDDGQTEALTILDALRIAMLRRPHVTIPGGARYQRSGDLRTSLPDPAEQPDPMWAGDISATYTLPRIEREDEALI